MGVRWSERLNRGDSVKRTDCRTDIDVMNTQRHVARRPDPSTVLMAVIAVMLGYLVLDRVDARGVSGRGAAAVASGSQPDGQSGLISAADQRKQMIAELKLISQRIDAVERRLAKPLQVKVLEMPAQKEKPAPAAGQ